jgi:hypothetical protein
VIAALGREDPPLLPAGDVKVIAAGDHVTLRVRGARVEGVFQALVRGDALQEQRCWTRAVDGGLPEQAARQRC